MNFIDELQDIIKGDPKAYGGISDEDFTTRTELMPIDYLNRSIDCKGQW